MTGAALHLGPAQSLYEIFSTWMGVERMKLRNVAPRTLGRSLAQMDMMAVWAEEYGRERAQGGCSRRSVPSDSA